MGMEHTYLCQGMHVQVCGLSENYTMIPQSTPPLTHAHTHTHTCCRSVMEEEAIPWSRCVDKADNKKEGPPKARSWVTFSCVCMCVCINMCVCYVRRQATYV
jgi:hypothetical protein